MDSGLTTDKHGDGKERTTKRKGPCLGIDCEQVLSNGEFFCDKCKKIKDKTRISTTEQRGMNFSERRGLVIRKAINE